MSSTGIPPFDELYRGNPPWEIARPQPAIADLIERGEITGRVLDIGCGTGENSLLCRARGLDVTGIDGSRIAIEQAQRKSAERGHEVPFVMHDALHLDSLVRGKFDAVIDSGLFHVFSDEQRAAYVASLKHVLAPNARIYVVCFSEAEPDWGGPRRVTQAEIRAAFADGFIIERIEPTRFATNLAPEGSSAWLAVIRYTPTA